ncbi:MAG: hypothetical protein HY519_04080 [Candidatus Aenigmarchaeota archaeon]|nr:hypothetical protein [Candidatus Aenigmarchaeota archaeon]
MGFFGPPSSKQPAANDDQNTSREYKQFKKEEKSALEGKDFTHRYARLCRAAYKLFKLNPPNGFAEKLDKAILISDLAIRPAQVFALFIATLIVTLLLAAIPILMTGSMTLKLMILSLPLIISYYTLTYPIFLADVTRIRASDESVKVVLYMAIYLRQNPGIEGAIGFAARHATGPFGADLKKIMWDLQIGKYQSIDDAFTSRVKKWVEWDKDFIEAFQLLMGITSVVSEEKRKKLLQDALDLILERTYQKMKDYGRNLRTPTLFIHTLGMTMPILGLVMFPLVAIFMSGDKPSLPFFIAFGYTVVLPIILFWYTRRTISKRPGAYSYPDISRHPELPPPGKIMFKGKDGKKVLIPVRPISLAIFLLLVFPGLAYMLSLASDWVIYTGNGSTPGLWKQRILLEYNALPCDGRGICVINPAFTAILFSLSIIWAVGFSLAFHLYASSFQRVKIRNGIKQLESDFIVGLSRLSDVLSTNVPIETAMEEVARKYKMYGYTKSPMYEFFTSVLRRLKQVGQTLDQALFDKQTGLIKLYPSKLINDTLKVIASSSKKGPLIVSLVTKSISDFLSRTRSVEELIKDILDEVVSNAKLQVSFIAPFVTGIVAGTAVLIVQLLYVIGNAIDKINNALNIGGSGGVKLGIEEFIKGLNLETMMPPSVFQLVVGTYMLEIVILLGFFLNGLENGFDNTTRNYTIGRYLIIATVLYSIVVIVSIAMFAGVICKVASIGGTGCLPT